MWRQQQMLMYNVISMWRHLQMLMYNYQHAAPFTDANVQLSASAHLLIVLFFFSKLIFCVELQCPSFVAMSSSSSVPSVRSSKNREDTPQSTPSFAREEQMVLAEQTPRTPPRTPIKKRKGRGPALCSDVRTGGVKIFVEWNDEGQPTQPINKFKTYVGAAARNHVKINYESWRDVPDQLKEQIYVDVTVILHNNPNYIIFPSV
jgi:hypothetical protein